jgi:hypothetical protein
MSMCLQAYLQHREHQALIDPYISPAFVSKDILAQFPSVAIVVGDIDPVLDGMYACVCVCVCVYVCVCACDGERQKMNTHTQLQLHTRSQSPRSGSQ